MLGPRKNTLRDKRGLQGNMQKDKSFTTSNLISLLIQ